MISGHIEQERRRFFRLPYPSHDCPTLRILGGEYAVAELSEAGMRFYCSAHELFMVGQPVRGTVVFRDGVKQPIVGRVLRLQKNEVTLVLVKGIPGQRMFQEQLYLVRKMKDSVV